MAIVMEIRFDTVIMVRKSGDWQLRFCDNGWGGDDGGNSGGVIMSYPVMYDIS